MKKDDILDGFKNLLTLNESINSSVRELCKPLEKFGITYFYYMRIYNDGRRLFVANKLDFFNFILEKEIHTFQNTELKEQLKNLSEFSYHKFLWTGTPKDMAHNILYDLDIWNGYTIYNEQKDFIEVYGVGTERNNENIINFYLNNENILKHFLLYFKEKFEPFFKKIPHEKLLRFPITVAKDWEMDLENKIHTFITETMPKKYMLKNGIFISRREAEALSYLSMGMQIKEVAKKTSLSPRTIEYYVNNIKNKTSISRKSDLVKIFLESSIKIYKI